MPENISNQIRNVDVVRKLVLTGVTGHKSGGVLIELIAKNLEVVNAIFKGGIVILCREASNTEKVERLIPAAKIEKGDFGDFEFLEKALSNADTVIHVAGIQRSRELVKAASSSGVRRLILVHTTGIYSKYKAAGEEYRHIDDYVYKTCKENNIVLTILRPTMIYGNIHDNNVVTFIRMVDKLPIMPVVSGARYELQPVHYADLADAYYAVLLNEDETANKDFILSGRDPILLRDMLSEIGKNLGKKVKFISCPYIIAYTGAWILFVLTLSKKDYREKVQRLCEPRVYSHMEATKAFGYNPRPFQVGIVEEVKEYLLEKRK